MGEIMAPPDNSELWRMVHGINERLIRTEERFTSADTSMREMKDKLDDLYDLAQQAAGAGKAARMFGKWGWGLAGGVGAVILTFWSELVTIIFKH